MTVANSLPRLKKVCSCGAQFWTKDPKRKFHNRVCSSRAAGKRVEGLPRPGIIRKITCQVCGESRRIFDFSQAQAQAKMQVCRWCEDGQRYQAKRLPTPNAVIAAIRANGGSITYLEIQTMFALSNKQSYQLVADLVTDGYLRGLEHGRFALGDSAEPGAEAGI